MADDTHVTLSKLEVDASQLKTLPPEASAAGKAVEKALAGMDASAKMTATELRLLTAAVQKETAAMAAETKKLTVKAEEEANKRLVTARATAQTELEIDRAALAELLAHQEAFNAKDLAKTKAAIKQKQSALDAGHDTRARKSRQQHQKDIQQATLDAKALALASSQKHQTKMQDTRLLANSATTQATLQTKTLIANSNNVTKTTIANSKNATAVQLAGINQVTAANNALARSQLSAQQATQAQTLSAQNFQQRMALQKQGQRGQGGLLPTLGQAGGAIYAIKTVVQGVEQVVRVASEMSKLSASYDRQMLASKNLAGGIGNLEKLMDAYAQATGGAVGKVTALQDVTRLQAIGFGENAEELERFVRISRGISLAVGKDMADITQEVALTIANQSTRRLDQIGLGVEEVRERIEELREENKGWTREMAFQEAVLQVASEKYGALADSLQAQATGAEKAAAAWKDLGLAIAEASSGPVNAFAEAAASELKRAENDVRKLHKWMAEQTPHAIPGGWENPMTISQAKFERGNVERNLAGKREQLASGVYPASLPAEIKQLEDDLRGLGITIAGLNAKIALETGSYDQPMAGGVSGGQPRAEPKSGLDLNDDQWKVLYDLEQERNDMEAGFAEQRNDEAEQYGEQRTKIIADYEKQIARDAEDFARDRQRAQADHQQAMEDVLTDGYARQQEMAEDYLAKVTKANRDSAERVAEINEDYDRKVADMRQESGDKIVELEEDFAEDQIDRAEDSAEKIAELEEDYAKQRRDNARDYNDSVMSAAANLDAKAVWEAQLRYQREQKEAREAHEKKVKDEEKSLQKANEEAEDKHAEKLAEEKESLNKEIAQATEMRDEAIEDEGNALKQRNEDARAAHKEQLDDAIKKDAQRLKDMQTDFDARLLKEDTDRGIRLGRMQDDHTAQLTELGTQHGKRMDQIAEQEGEAREAFDKAYTDRLEDAEIFNTAWMYQQAKAEDESLKVFRKLFEGMNEIMGATTIPTNITPSPISAGWRTQLEGLRNSTSFKLANATDPGERRRLNDLITWIDQQLGEDAGAAGTGGTDGDFGGEGFLPPPPAPPLVGNVTTSSTNMTLVIEAGAITITPLPGQSAASVGDDFEGRLLDVLQKVGRVGVR